MKTKNKLLKNKLLLAIASLGVVAGAPAQASLQLSFNVNGGPSTTIIDNVSFQDQNPALNIINLINGFQPTLGLFVDGSTHTSIDGPPTNILSSGSSSVFNNTGGDVHVIGTVSQTDFFSPAFLFQASGSGTFLNATGSPAPDGSTITLTWYDDPSNHQGANFAGDTPGNLLATFTHAAAGNGDSFSFNSPLSLLASPDLAPFSMTLQFDYLLRNGDRLVSRGETLIKPVGVPEPGILLLLGAGLTALRINSRRKA